MNEIVLTITVRTDGNYLAKRLFLNQDVPQEERDRLADFVRDDVVPNVRKLESIPMAQPLSARPKKEELMTVGELKTLLNGYTDETKIFFGCESLKFYRLKMRGENLLQVEFNQTVSDDELGRVYVENH